MEAWDELSTWNSQIFLKKELFLSFVNSHPTMFRRYEDFIHSSLIEDCLNSTDKRMPRILELIRVSRIFTAKNLALAIKGDWWLATSQLIQQFKAGRKMCVSARGWVISQMSRIIMDNSLKGLWMVVTHPSAPRIFTKNYLSNLISP
jgi:hypothetical protein